MPTVNMTAQWVGRVRAAGQSREDWFDATLTGLGLRVSPSGKKVWFVMYRVKGDATKHRHTLGPFPALSLADAREGAREVILEASRGRDVGAAKKEAKGAPTFELIARDYVERYAKPKKRSWRQDELNLEKHVLPRWGRRKACEITTQDVHALLDRLVDAGTPIQANRVLALVRKLFNFAISRGHVTNNPCTVIQAPSAENERDKWLSEAEIKAVWVQFEKQSLLLAGAFKLLMLTAQRRSEVLSMRWADVDFQSAVWTIPSARAKNKRTHLIPLSPAALDVLREVREQTGDQEWVFPSPRRCTGKPINNIQKAMDRIREGSGVDFVAHDIRRTVATHISEDASKEVIKKILNHLDGDVTNVYIRSDYMSQKRAVLEDWAKRLQEILRKDYPEGARGQSNGLPQPV